MRGDLTPAQALWVILLVAAAYAIAGAIIHFDRKLNERESVDDWMDIADAVQEREDERRRLRLVRGDR